MHDVAQQCIGKVSGYPQQACDWCPRFLEVGLTSRPDSTMTEADLEADDPGESSLSQCELHTTNRSDEAQAPIKIREELRVCIVVGPLQHGPHAPEQSYSIQQKSNGCQKSDVVLRSSSICSKLSRAQLSRLSLNMV